MRPRYSVARCCCDGGTVIEPTPGEILRYDPGGESFYWYVGGGGFFPEPIASLTMGKLLNTFGGYYNFSSSAGVRYTGVALNQGEQIFAARLIWTPKIVNKPWPCTTPATLPWSYGDQAGACVFQTAMRMRAVAEDVDDAAKKTNEAECDNAPRTPGILRAYLVAADASGAGAYAVDRDEGGTEIEFSDVTTAVQTVINRPGWQSGNAIQLFADEEGSDADDSDPGGYGTWSQTTSLWTLEITRRA